MNESESVCYSLLSNHKMERVEIIEKSLPTTNAIIQVILYMLIEE